MRHACLFTRRVTGMALSRRAQIRITEGATR
jgi:hypothetical protein